MYYEGININKGKRVEKEDAFGYAMDCILNNDDDYEAFIQEFGKSFVLKILSCKEAYKEFAETFVEWFYSGDWLCRR